MVGEDFSRILVKKGKAGDVVRAKHSASIQWTQPLPSKRKQDTIKRRDGRREREGGREREGKKETSKETKPVQPFVTSGADCSDS